MSHILHTAKYTVFRVYAFYNVAHYDRYSYFCYRIIILVIRIMVIRVPLCGTLVSAVLAHHLAQQVVVHRILFIFFVRYMTHQNNKRPLTWKSMYIL